MAAQAIDEHEVSLLVQEYEDAYAEEMDAASRASLAAERLEELGIQALDGKVYR